MALLVELSPDAEAQLAAEAQRQGIAPEEYAGRLLEQKASSPKIPPKALTLGELHTMLQELAEDSADLPKYPTSAFSRESFYQDSL